jgi:hypothetical protein
MITDDAVCMIKLGPGVMVPIDRLPHPLRVKWDQCHAKMASGEDVRRPLKALRREIQEALGPELLLRAAQVHGATIMDLGTVAGARCLTCGATNPAGAAKCGSCGAVMR